MKMSVKRWETKRALGEPVLTPREVIPASVLRVLTWTQQEGFVLMLGGGRAGPSSKRVSVKTACPRLPSSPNVAAPWGLVGGVLVNPATPQAVNVLLEWQKQTGKHV